MCQESASGDLSETKRGIQSARLEKRAHVSHIIRHAYLGDPEQPIEVSFRWIHVPRDGGGHDALEIVLEDRGTAVNPKEMCGRALEDVRPGGLGLHFIRQSMDTVEFSHCNGRNQLRLVKILHVQASQKGS